MAIRTQFNYVTILADYYELMQLLHSDQFHFDLFILRYPEMTAEMQWCASTMVFEWK